MLCCVSVCKMSSSIFLSLFLSVCTHLSFGSSYSMMSIFSAGASAPHAGSGSEGPGDQLGALAEPSLLPTLRQKLWTPGLKGGKSRPKSQLSLLTPTANYSWVTTAQCIYTATDPSVFISVTFLDTFYSLMAKALVSFELNDLFLYWKFVSAVVLVLFLFFAILSRLFGTTGNLRKLWENISQPGLFSLNTISFLA